ncbi:MAG: metallophosphoesterase [Thermoplasmata archaeon]|nr:metallophosphoesterase [Thermoplasmata archaeon]
MILAHISDLHLTGKNFVPEWGENLIKILDEKKPDIVVVTGDITDDGYIHEYEIAKRFLDKIKARKIVVPGNHDARNKGYEIFEEIFGTRYPFYKGNGITLLGIDSSEPDIDDGHIGRENYGLIREKMEGEGLKFLALHHHLIPIPGTGRERNIPIDAGDVLNLCIELGINFVLSGHKHLPWVWKLENTYFIAAGTACSRRLKGKSYPSFNLFRIAENRVEMMEINVESGEERKILDYTGDIP